MQHQELIDSVRRRSSLSGSETLQVAIGVVVDALVRRLDNTGRDRLAGALPRADWDALRWDMALRKRPDTSLVAEVSRNTGYPSELARTLAESVLATLADADPAMREVLHEQLGDGLLRSPAGAARRAEGAADQPRRLDDEEIARALRDMPGWTGGPRQLVRTVGLPADRQRPLLNRVERVQRELDHRALVEQTPEAVTFRLRTGSLNAVTEADLRLARSIDDAVARIDSGG